MDLCFKFIAILEQQSKTKLNQREHQDGSLRNQSLTNLQDFLATVEDKNITGYTEALTWKEENDTKD